MSKQLIVAVGSTNPTKVEPVREVFTRHFPHVSVEGVAVNSSVDEQPIGDGVIYQGADHRAQEALRLVVEATYGVGIEGGLVERPYGWFEHSLVVIRDRRGASGVGSSGGLVLPKTIINHIRKGQTLEEAIDALFGTQRIGEGIGMFGMMTKGVVTRSSGVMHGVAFALARFLHKNLYEIPG